MSVLSKEIGDICISCTVLPIIGLVSATAVIYYIIKLVF